jgi:dihydropteroate synthase
MASELTFVAKGRCISFPRRPLVMGIININDDSFCGDGSLDVSDALAQAREQLINGADIIDIGAESARTNRVAITPEEEVNRLRPFIAAWPALLAGIETKPFDVAQLWPPLLSINTWRPEVAAAVLPLGGDILNDIGALPDARNAQLCAQHGACLLLMHSIGLPKIPHTHVGYQDVMQAIGDFFDTKLSLCLAAGLPAEQVILDPGIDFAKQRQDNLTVYRDLQTLHRFGRPLLLPVSRKTVIGQVLDLPRPVDRDAGTVACIVAGMDRGAQIFRVHNVRAAALSVKLLWSLGG